MKDLHDREEIEESPRRPMCTLLVRLYQTLSDREPQRGQEKANRNDQPWMLMTYFQGQQRYL